MPQASGVFLPLFQLSAEEDDTPGMYQVRTATDA